MYDLYIDFRDDNVLLRNFAAYVTRFRSVRAMDMVQRYQTAGDLEFELETYDEDVVKRFKFGLFIRIQESNNGSRVYAGYVRSVKRTGDSSYLVRCVSALGWLNQDDDTASYTNLKADTIIQDVLSRGNVMAPWHQVVANPRGLAPGTYKYGEVGKTNVGPKTLVGAFYPKGGFETTSQTIGQIDSIVLDLDKAEKSGSFNSIMNKAVLSEAGYLFAGSWGRIEFFSRKGRAYRPTKVSITDWDSQDYAVNADHVTELEALLPNRKSSADELFSELHNVVVPSDGLFLKLEDHRNGFPVEIKGNIRIEGLSAGVTCQPSFNGLHLYLQFANSAAAAVTLGKVSIYADITEIQSISTLRSRTIHRGGRQAVLEFGDLNGDEQKILDYYIEGLSHKNELSRIYMTRKSTVDAAKNLDLLSVVSLSKGSISEDAYISEIVWEYDGREPRIELGLHPYRRSTAFGEP